jgi:hypothetical protein
MRKVSIPVICVFLILALLSLDLKAVSLYDPEHPIVAGPDEMVIMSEPVAEDGGIADAFIPPPGSPADNEAISVPYEGTGEILPDVTYTEEISPDLIYEAIPISAQAEVPLLYDTIAYAGLNSGPLVPALFSVSPIKEPSKNLVSINGWNKIKQQIDMSTVGDPKYNIYRTLMGYKIEYYSIAGKPMYYTVSPKDIVSIEPTTFEGKKAWIVRVGTGLSWDMTFDSSGTKILNTKQLFYT